MSERVITIHKTPHVSWQGTEAAAAATGLIGDAHEANVNRTENGLALKKNADAPKSMCTLGATLTQTSEVSKILREGTKTPHGAQRQIDLQNVPNPQASFEDTSHAYESGYLDGLAKGRAELSGCQLALQQAWDSNREREAELVELRAAPAVKVKPLAAAIETLPRRREAIGGQIFSYVKLEDVLRILAALEGGAA